MHQVDSNNKIENIFLDQESIKNAIIEHNKFHFQKAHQTEACKDKIYAKLQEDSVRNRILVGELDRSECDNQNICNFLTLLKRPNNLLSTTFI